MLRLLLSAAVGLLVAGAAAAQCQPWYPPYPVVVIPAYPMTPAIWGAPAPRPLPPALPPVPKRPTRIAEEDEPAVLPKPAETKEPRADAKKDDAPRIPKVKIPLPGDPVDKPLPKEPPKADVPKADAPGKDAPAGKAVEQFVIPAEGKGEPRAEVKVGFFNHTDRDITLVVNGESVRLPRAEYVTLRLPRTFTWAERGARGTDVVVPPDAEGIEIVFRR
jgi:hypothetical protein